MELWFCFFFFFSSRRRHTRLVSDWSSDVCSSDLGGAPQRSRGPWTVTTRSNARGWPNAASSAAADACTQRRSRRKGRGRACRSSVARLLNRRLERLAAQNACEQPLAGDDVTRQLLDVPRIAVRRQRPLLQPEGVDEPPQHVEGPG